MAHDADRFDARWRAAQCYQPFFCEENVWQLLRGDALACALAAGTSAGALFVTNAAREVAMWGQRAATRDPILWDYHVVALLAGPRASAPTTAREQENVHENVHIAVHVLDLDDREHVAWPLAAWLAHAFRASTPAPLQPRFRVVPAAELFTTFSSDRSHMRDAAGEPLRAFPPWPAPFQAALGNTLPRYLDLADPIAGATGDAAWLLAAASELLRDR